MKKDHRSIGQIYRDMNNGSAGALDDTASLSALEIQMRTVEAKLDEVLEYGTTQAKVQYAKDTPGQTPGVEQEPTQKPKSGLAVDGVPKAGGEMNKPDAKLQMDKTLPEENEIEENNLVRDLDPVGQADADIDNDGDVDKSDKYLKNRRKKIKKAINKEGYKRTTDIDVEQGERDLKKAKLDKKIADVKEAKNCGCGEDPCKTYGKGGTKEMEEQAQLDEYGALMAKKGMCPMCSKKDGKEVLMSSCGCQNEEVEFDEAMSVTLRKSKSQPGTFKVHSVGDKMKAHGGIKPGERVRDHEIDGLHDSRIKVKYHKVIYVEWSLCSRCSA